MGLEAIVSAITEEAADQVAAGRAQTESRLRAIRAEAEQRAESERQRWSVSRHEEADRASARIVNRARLGAERRLAQAREELFREAIDQLRDLLAEFVNSSAYEDAFSNLYREAAAIVPDGDATILVRASDVALVQRLPRATSALVSVSTDDSGGLDIEAPDGRAVRNTFAARLNRCERRLRLLTVEMIPEMATAGVRT